MRRFTLLSLGIMLLSGCASSLGDAQQRVEVVTPGANDAVCYINNGDNIYTVKTPGSLLLAKRSAPLHLRCLADGNREKLVTIDKEHDDKTLGNIMTGILPGVFVDHTTGAMYEYPKTITVDFTDMPATTMPLPDYHNHITDNPDLFGMEEFRAGRAALIRDKYEKDFDLQEREYPVVPPLSEFTSVKSSSEAKEGGKTESTASSTSTAKQSSNSAPPADVSNDFVSDLTKQMNPKVFGPKSKGFVGGTSNNSGASSGPIQIVPIEE